MEWIKEYLLSITAAGILCAIVKQLIGEKTANGKIIRMVAGIFLTITMISPLINVRFRDVSFYYQDFLDTAESLTEEGKENANKEMGDIISEQTVAYILNEAAILGLDIQANVVLSDNTPPEPVQIGLTGDASPYKKDRLIRSVSENLNISREHIIWN